MARTGISRWSIYNSTYVTPDGSYDILVNGSNHYINFGTLSGTSGYGIRDNGGTIQWKNSGGSWQDIGTGGGGGSPGGSTTQLQYNNAGAFGGITGATTDGTVVTLTAPIIATSQTNSYATASTIAIFDGSKNLVSAAVATYPSLTELTYLKGVTSAIQTQINGKQATITFGTGVQTALGVNIGSAGAPVLFNGALGTPTSGVATNLTGTALGLSIGGNAATVTNGVYTTDAGTVYQTPTGTPAGFIIASQAVGDILYASSTTAWSRLGVGTNGYVLTLAAGVPTWAAASGGGGSPGGSDTQIQYNNAGAFGGDANFTISSGTVTFGKDTIINTLTAGLGASSIASNAGFGLNVLTTITTGNYNLALGYEAMKTVTTGGHNIGIGYQAMYKSTGGGYNTAIGTSALTAITSGADNIAIGSFCGQTITTGSQNVGIGDYALGGNDGNMTTSGGNVAIGYAALGGLTTGGSANNVGIGSLAGTGITTGTNNIVIGRTAGNSLSTGSYNIIIGYNSQVNSATTSYQMSLGNMIYGASLDGSDTTISTGGIGIAVKVPTSRCDFIGSSTSRASMRILSGTAPTSPNDGDIWYDGTDIKMRIAGATKAFVLV